jgi:hypothetical protein
MTTLQQEAMKTALHELITLHGLVVTDKPVGDEAFMVDTSDAVNKLEQALKLSADS